MMVEAGGHGLIAPSNREKQLGRNGNPSYQVLKNEGLVLQLLPLRRRERWSASYPHRCRRTVHLSPSPPFSYSPTYPNKSTNKRAEKRVGFREIQRKREEEEKLQKESSLLSPSSDKAYSAANKTRNGGPPTCR
ncbi:hypothetical protein MA16_Dca028293 [Dendrobium catenatum]|uniref:Uncharacterized protein n=1 Tax=Dendrobium catenatum TaxID=906689 RepID=A0A2I0VBY3_9ASPA|nr:hypothetical protein MA16_Dca028293 [Dendrobium catenatum]